MDYIDALVKAKKALRLKDTDIARDAGMSRQWIGMLRHREAVLPKKSKLALTHVLCERIDSEIVRHAEEVALLERIRADLMAATKEDKHDT